MPAPTARLGLSPAAFWAYYGLLWWLAAIDVVLVVIAVVGLTTGHRKADVLAACGFLLVAGLAGIAVLVPAGRKRVRAGRDQAAVLESDGTSLRLRRTGRTDQRDQHLDLARVARVELVYRILTNPGHLSAATFLDAHGKRIATWDLYPLTGRRLGAWFRAQGVEADVRVLGRTEPTPSHL